MYSFFFSSWIIGHNFNLISEGLDKDTWLCDLYKQGKSYFSKELITVAVDLKYMLRQEFVWRGFINT